MAVFGGQDCANPFAKSRRALADVDRDVEDFTNSSSHELTLRVMELIMQPAQNALPGT